MIDNTQINDAPPLTPGFHGKECLGNGEHEDIDCCCDECDYYLDCFPDWKETYLSIL